MTERIPSYRLHKPTGLAVVTLGGHDSYLGTYGSPESQTEYKRRIGEWLVRGKSGAVGNGEGLSINELILTYVRHAQEYYRSPDGQPGREVDNIRYAMRPLKELYGLTLAKDFGPLALKTVRQHMIEANLCRRLINQRMGTIKRMFKWASGDEIVPPTIYHALLCVTGLHRGRSAARETEPVKAVPERHVYGTLPFMCPTVRAMVELQFLTGMRSGEMVIMRAIDLDMSGKVWHYAPIRHKTQHHGHSRVVQIGPKAQEILRPYLKSDLHAYIFSPAQAQEERRVAMRAQRKTKVQPSQLHRKKKNPKTVPGQRYTTSSYYRAVNYAIKSANADLLAEVKAKLPPNATDDNVATAFAKVSIPYWHPHQLRHTAASIIRKEKNLDAARAVLGQRSLQIADTYAEMDAALAATVAGELG